MVREYTVSAQVLTAEAVAHGFLEVVAAVEDLRLDVPDSPDVLATFISRAVVDEVLPPSFVESIPAGTHEVSAAVLPGMSLALRWRSAYVLVSLSHLPRVSGVLQCQTARYEGSLREDAHKFCICQARIEGFACCSCVAESAGAAEVRRKCGVLLKGRHAAERMQRCWGAGAGLRLMETRGAVAAMLQASQCVSVVG